MRLTGARFAAWRAAMESLGWFGSPIAAEDHPTVKCRTVISPERSSPRSDSVKRKLLAAYVAATFLGLVGLTPAWASGNPPQILVDSATLSVESIMDGAQGQAAQSYLHRAAAVVVCPNIFRAGLVFGGEGGACVLSARAADGAWSYPAFYNLGGGTFGAQIGVQNSQVMMMVMTHAGLNTLLNSQIKFGGEAGASAATCGTGGAGGMSTDLNTDIVVF